MPPPCSVKAAKPPDCPLGSGRQVLICQGLICQGLICQGLICQGLITDSSSETMKPAAIAILFPVHLPSHRTDLSHPGSVRLGTGSLTL
ncbi:hypothetical protein EYF80_041450 [Liparis tanakae]|uniref:Uncharacterized protein n=1 Tax=Liparis tanakae TaxID=230148 RepID=A0A4Z2G6Z9_9TELE|nr:hypothetical protein EYF80_041450 [Liparis tanakae]